MPPEPEKTAATVRASETTIRPTRAGDWKNAAQSPRPKATTDRPRNTTPERTLTTVHKSSRAPVIASLSAGRFRRLTRAQLQALDRHRHGVAAAQAQRRDAALQAALLQRVQQRRQH